MRWTLVVIFAYLLAVLQTTLFAPNLLGLNAFGTSIRPDLLLLLALFLALRVPPGTAFVTGWALGFVEDLGLGQGPLGVTAVVFALMMALLSMAQQVLAPARLVVQVVLALAVTVTVRVPQQLILWWLTHSEGDFLLALQRGLGDGLYTAILAPYLFWLLSRTLERPGSLSV